MMAEGKKSPNWNKNDSSPILKIMALPIAIVIIALGIFPNIVTDVFIPFAGGLI